MKKFNKFKISLYTILLFVMVFSINIFSATLDVPYLLALFSTDSTFNISPFIFMDLNISGGVKYGTSVNFRYFFSNDQYFDVTDTDSKTHTIYPSLYVYSLSATLKDLFNLFDLSVFYGNYIDVCPAGKFNNIIYTLSPDNTFDSVYKISGYGINFEFGFLNDTIIIDLAGYQKLTANNPKALDLYIRILTISNLEFSIGGGTDNFSTYRLATRLQFKQENFKILITGGTENLKTVSSIKDIYLIFEQSVYLNQFKETFSVFSKPAYYNGTSLSDTEKNTFLIFMDLSYNNKFETFYTGLLTNVNLVNYAFSSIYLSPYLNIYFSGIKWDIKVDLNILDFSNFFNSMQISFETKF